MQHVAVDSYGACLHNRDLPPSIQGSHHMDNRYLPTVTVEQGVTKRCRLPLLTNSASYTSPKAGGGGGVAGLIQ